MIVGTIGSVDDLIENNKSKIQKLKRIADLIFDSFDFSTSRLSTIGDTSKEIICGTTPSTKNYENWVGDMPFITTPDMDKNTFVICTSRNVNQRIKSIQSRVIDRGTVSISCIGTIGVIGMTIMPSITNQQINTVVPFNDECYYMYHVLKKNIIQLKNMASGSATPNISKDSFSHLVYQRGADFNVHEFNAKVSPIYDQIENLEVQNNKLVNYRKTLLAKCF